MLPTEMDKFLDGVDIFRGMSDANRKAAAALFARRSVAKRDTLFLEGRPGDAMYVLASGSIQLVKTAADGKEVVIRSVVPGEVFGEAMLFERDTYPVTAIALKRSVVCALHRRDLRRLLDQATFREDFIRHLVMRLRYLTDRLLYLTACDVEERFARFLLERCGRAPRLALPMAKKDLAAAVGATPETLSRLLLRLRRERLVSWRGKAVDVSPAFWKRHGLE